MAEQFPGLVNTVRPRSIPHDIFNEINKFWLLPGDVLVIHDGVYDRLHVRVKVLSFRQNGPQVVDPGVLLLLSLVTLALAGEEMSNYQLPIAIFSLIAKVVKKVISCIMWQLLISNWDNAKI